MKRERVKSLAKPSVRAWTSEPTLLAASGLVRSTHRHRSTAFARRRQRGERERLETCARRSKRDEKCSRNCQTWQTVLLRDAGHNPGLEMCATHCYHAWKQCPLTLRFPMGYPAGRLIKDIDPPGFDSLCFVRAPEPGTMKRAEQPARVSPKSSGAELKTRQKLTAAAEANRLQKERQARLACSQSFASGVKEIAGSRAARVKRLEAAQKKA